MLIFLICFRSVWSLKVDFPRWLAAFRPRLLPSDPRPSASPTTSCASPRPPTTAACASPADGRPLSTTSQPLPPPSANCTAAAPTIGANCTPRGPKPRQQIRAGFITLTLSTISRRKTEIRSTVGRCDPTGLWKLLVLFNSTHSPDFWCIQWIYIVGSIFFVDYLRG